MFNDIIKQFSDNCRLAQVNWLQAERSGCRPNPQNPVVMCFRSIRHRDEHMISLDQPKVASALRLRFPAQCCVEPCREKAIMVGVKKVIEGASIMHTIDGEHS